MYWEKIEGWFDFANIYDKAVNSAKNHALFVEIGAWKGRSTVYMAEKIKNSGKYIRFYVVDTFLGDSSGVYDKDPDIINDTLYDTFCKNIEPVKNYIRIIRKDSKIAHEYFEEGEIDFLFIDGDHRYEAVKQDLINWYPKIRPGGIIAGHDYINIACEVKKAVDEFFPTPVQKDRTSWIYVKPNRV